MTILSEEIKDSDYINLEDVVFDNQAVSLIPKEVSIANYLIAFKTCGNILHVAMEDTSKKNILDKIKFLTRKNILPFAASKEQILWAIETYYNSEDTEKALKELKNQNEISPNKSYSKFLDGDNVINAPVVKLLNSLIYQAIYKNASDIHIEPFDCITKIRFRIDGSLNEIRNIPKELHSSICARVKIMAQMNIAERRVPQDGKMHMKIDNKHYDFRVSSMPTVYGEKIVIRILYKSDFLDHLSSLDYVLKSNSLFEKVLTHSCGIILITGPTGSGKSTTLYTMLKHLNNSSRNIITIEDPVEYALMGLNQINVNNKAGLTFDSGLRSILRQDPDVIMIGEIRDEKTAQIAIRAAITGHLVLSTLHTNDAASSVLRLVDMGVKNYFVADALVAVMAQRLVKVICPNCKQEVLPSQVEILTLKLETGDKLYKGMGCTKCNNSGYKGRTLVYELMYLNSAHKRIIETNGSIEELREFCYKNGMSSIKNNCIELIKKGITTYEELLKIAVDE